jgi:hypothetical protein
MLTGQANEAVAEALAARAINERTHLADEWNATVPLVLLHAYALLEKFEAMEREATTALAAPQLSEPAKLVMVPGPRALAWFEAGRLAEAADATSAAEKQARRLGLTQHFFAVDYLRVLAGLALERGDLDTAEQLTGQALSISQGRPVRDGLGAKPDELVDPNRPQRELFVSGVGGQRRGAVNDHWAGHRMVGTAPGDDAPAHCGDVAVPPRRLAEGERHHEPAGGGWPDAQWRGVGAAGVAAVVVDDPDDGHVPTASDPQHQRIYHAGDRSDQPPGARPEAEGVPARVEWHRGICCGGVPAVARVWLEDGCFPSG